MLLCFLCCVFEVLHCFLVGLRALKFYHSCFFLRCCFLLYLFSQWSFCIVAFILFTSFSPGRTVCERDQVLLFLHCFVLSPSFLPPLLRDLLLVLAVMLIFSCFPPFLFLGEQKPVLIKLIAMVLNSPAKLGSVVLFWCSCIVGALSPWQCCSCNVVLALWGFKRVFVNI